MNDKRTFWSYRWDFRIKPSVVIQCASISLAIFASVVATGCSTNLHVWEEKVSGLSKLEGIPVRLGEVFIKQGRYTKLSKNAEAQCVPQNFQNIVILPTGSTYYVNVDSDWLAKAEFAVSYHNNGTLAGVSMNSDVAGGVKAATESLTQLLPFVGLLPSEAGTGPAATMLENNQSLDGQDKRDSLNDSDAKSSPKPLCDGAPDQVKFVLFRKSP